MLDSLAPVTGLNRSCLATALGNYGKKEGMEKPPGKGKRKPRPAVKRGGRPVKYGEDFVKVLSRIWDDYGKPCGKLLVPMIRGIIGFLEGSGNPDYGITLETRRLLLEVSAAEADILLKPARKALEIKGVSTTRAVQTPLRCQIPVMMHFDRGTVKPGKLAFDTVAQRSASGQFCKPQSASYAMVSFQSANLRVHHPAEFMAAVLSNQGGYYRPHAYIAESRRMKLFTTGPDINAS
jgi:hypothetical protein